MTDLSLSSLDATYPIEIMLEGDGGTTFIDESVRDDVSPYPGRRKAITTVDNVSRNRYIPDVWVDDSRNDLLDDFGKATLKDRYQIENENPQDRFANSVRYYADDASHAQRMYDHISKKWCIGSTPITSNGGTTKGNLISCFINSVDDSLEGIVDRWVENIWLGAKGGGLGTYYGKVRSNGEKAGSGKTSGAMSFMKVNDALTACISQAGNRRASGAIYMDISHPEIEIFLDMRREAGGDPATKCLSLHHGVLIPDAFYDAVYVNGDWDLISPWDGTVKATVNARELFQKLVAVRLDKGEPYIVNIDHVNRAIPEHHKKSNLLVTASNLCSEIMLPIGPDHHGNTRTAVCCLFQLNLEMWDEWKDHPTFIEDVARFVDNVLQDFIDNGGDQFINARYAASRERSIGVGVMGFHGYLQQKSLPFESAMAKSFNIRAFKHIRAKMDDASRILAEERGPCPDAAEYGIMERFSNKIAIAPTASVSIIMNASPGIDITPANIFTQKTLDGSFTVKNKYLERILEGMGKNTKTVWDDILRHGGSVQHIDWLDQDVKDCYKTSFEVDPRFVIEHAADRTPYICQSQSLNLFIPPDIDKYDLAMIHLMAYEKGIKSLYYLRSFSLQRADSSTGETVSVNAFRASESTDYEECIFCQ